MAVGLLTQTFHWEAGTGSNLYARGCVPRWTGEQVRRWAGGQVGTWGHLPGVTKIKSAEKVEQ